MPLPEPELEPVLTDRTPLLRTVRHPEEIVTEEGVEIEMDPPPHLTARKDPLRSVSPEAEKIAEKGKKPEAPQPKPYQSPVPFPQRLEKAKLDQRFEKSLEVLKQLRFTIPFYEALSQIPSYAKFLKEILANKRSLGDCRKVQLSPDCSAVISKNLPPKIRNPGRITVPCILGKVKFKEHLGDLGQETELKVIQQHQAAADDQDKPYGPYTSLTDRKGKLKTGQRVIKHSAKGGLQGKEDLLLLDGKLGSLPRKPSQMGSSSGP